MDEIADFILTPFREIVEKGKTAVENADNTQPMLKASQNLVKEGERALKKIEPLCKKHLEEYGSNFVDAIKENGKTCYPLSHVVVARPALELICFSITSRQLLTLDFRRNC